MRPASLLIASGFLMSWRHPNRAVAFVPWGDSKGGGLDFSMRF